MDRFEDIRAFVAVVETGGFGSAAEKLGVVKSAISRRVRGLEDRLGALLINRSNRKIVLTEEGQELYTRSVRILEDLRVAEELASNKSAKAVGLLRITAPMSFSIHCLAPVIGKFLRSHPNLTIELEMSDKIVDLVNDGYDLAIRISRLQNSALVARRISTIRHVCCASPDYLKQHGTPKKPADLARHRGVLYGYVEAGKHWQFADGQIAVPKSSLTLNNGDAIREAAIAGEGFVMLPTFIVHTAIKDGRLVPVLKSFMRPPLGLFALYPERRNLSSKVRLFIDFLAEEFGAQPHWDRDIFTATELAMITK